jgi:hypothetical protein
MGEQGVLEQRGFSASVFPGELPSATGKGRVVRALLDSPFISTSILSTSLHTPDKIPEDVTAKFPKSPKGEQA